MMAIFKALIVLAYVVFFICLETSTHRVDVSDYTLPDHIGVVLAVFLLFVALPACWWFAR